MVIDRLTRRFGLLSRDAGPRNLEKQATATEAGAATLLRVADFAQCSSIARRWRFLGQNGGVRGR